MTEQAAVLEAKTVTKPMYTVREDIMNRITPNVVDGLNLDVKSPVKVKKPRVDKIKSSVSTDNLLIKEEVVLDKPNNVVRFGNIFKGLMVKSVNGVKNVFMGTGIVFMNKIPKYLAPVAFIVRNALVIGTGIINVGAPIAISAYIGKTALASEFINANNALAYNLLCQASLLVTAAVLWIVGVEIAKHVYRNVSKTVADFEEIGKKS